ncbi:MAG: succinate dehydrogenase assembly factor 2 [Proteobacteria bacterium]|nr:MAG: succinate dehydrogenase assembly factor 2 [Pseudomonadota bacterium]
MTEIQFKRARWRSRRGMRELDVLLNRFIDTHYKDLSAVTRNAFDALLKESDIDLYAWLTGRTAPSNAEFRLLVALIRGCSN